jgi:hypothetical protein
MVTKTDARRGQNSEKPVSAYFARLNAQPAAKIFHQCLFTKHATHNAVTHMNDKPSHRFPIDKVIEGGQFFQFKGRHTDELGRFKQRFVAQVALMALKSEQKIYGQFCRVL